MSLRYMPSGNPLESFSPNSAHSVIKIPRKFLGSLPIVGQARQWPEVSDFVTLSESENTLTCENCTRNACNSLMSMCPKDLHVIEFNPDDGIWG